MKSTVLFTLSVIALLVAIYWAYTNDGNVEPYSAISTAILSMLTIYFSFREKSSPDKNRIVQDNKFSGGNEQDIDGDIETASQTNWFSFKNKQKIKK